MTVTRRLEVPAGQLEVTQVREPSDRRGVRVSPQRERAERQRGACDQLRLRLMNGEMC